MIYLFLKFVKIHPYNGSSCSARKQTYKHQSKYYPSQPVERHLGDKPFGLQTSGRATDPDSQFTPPD